MRRIILKELGVKGEVGVLSYKGLIKNLLQFPQDAQQGFSMSDIRSNVKILDALETSENELILEDADYSRLKTVVEGAKFGLAHANVIQFVDDIAHAEAFKVDASDK